MALSDLSQVVLDILDIHKVKLKLAFGIQCLIKWRTCKLRVYHYDQSKIEVISSKVFCKWGIIWILMLQKEWSSLSIYLKLSSVSIDLKHSCQKESSSTSIRGKRLLSSNYNRFKTQGFLLDIYQSVADSCNTGFIKCSSCIEEQL